MLLAALTALVRTLILPCMPLRFLGLAGTMG